MSTSNDTKTGVFVTRDDLQQYLYEVSQIDPMTGQELEEAMDSIRAQQPDQQETRRRLAERHLWLAVRYAYKYRRCFRTMSLLDLIQEANMAVLLAADRYEGKGFFSPYTAVYVRNALLQAISDDGQVQLHYRTYYRERQAGHTDELRHRYASSLDNEREDGWSLYDQLAETDDQPGQTDNQDAKELQVQQLLSTLDEREATIIGLRYGLNDYAHTQAATARRLGTSTSNAKRLEARAMAKLRETTYSMAV